MFSLFSGGGVQFKSSSSNKSGFTLTELIVVITILSILSVIGFVVMSHQSSVARDGKRISDIQTLSQSAKITSAQLRLLPTPIADSIALSVSGTFIGYQGFMSLALVNPLGYGSDKIFDPKDNIPYTYRVNQHYDSAQFMAYLENPRFERSIEIAKNQFLRNEEVGMNGEGFDGKKIQEIASQSLTSTLPSTLPSLFSQAYALDSSTTDLSSRYPYSAGDRLGIFVSKGSNQPLQNGVTGTGSRDISLSDTSTLTIIVGSSGADGYVSTDISTGSLLSLKDGSFDEKALLGMNSGSSGSGSGGGSGNNSSSGYVLTMGEYDAGGSPYVYGYLGPITAALFGGALTPNPAGDLTPKIIGGKNIDSLIIMEGQQYLILESGINIPSIIISEGSQSTSCVFAQTEGNIDIFACENISIVGPYTVGEMRSLGMEAGGVVPPPEPTCTNPSNVTEINNFNFNSSSKTITGYDGPKDVVIPCDIGGVSVLHIGNFAFYNKQITSVIIPDSVIDIGGQAFQKNSLTSVIIPGSVTSIGQYGFKENLLTSVEIKNGVTSIGYQAFISNQITSVTIPGSVTSIGTSAFYGNQLSFVDIQDGVVSIGDGAFYANQLTTVAIPSSVTSIGGVAFGYNQLTSVTIPGSVTTIGSGAFRNNLIASVTIQNGVTSIEELAFYKNQITSVTIPNSVINIGWIAFQDQANSAGNGTVYGPASGYVKDTYTNNSNSEFDKDKLPNYSDVLGSGGSVCPGNNPTDESYFTFNSSNGAITGYSINGPKDVVIPCVIGGVNVVKIEDSAFYNKQLTSVVIPDGVTRIDGWAFYNNQLTSVTIPNSVTRIDQGAFYRNQLTSVTIPDGVTSIGAQTFTWNQLTSVTIPDGVIAIGDEAFYNNQLTSVTIPNSVTSIGYRAFGMNQLTSVTIPNSVTSIGEQAFISNQLTSVIIPNSVTSIGNHAFFNNQLTSVTIPDGVTSIGDWTFAQNLLASVTIPNSVMSIGSHAFYTNYSLTSVTIPSSVVSIGDYAFAYTHLTSVTIPSSVVSIGDYAFYANPLLTSVTIPSSVVTIGMGTFAYGSLTSVTIPNSVVSIGNEAFYGNQLTSVTIPNSVMNIGGYAFYGNQLTSVTIPNSVTSIEELTFAGNQLTSVTIPNSVTSIGSNAFAYQINSLGNGTVSGPASGYVKDTYINNSDDQFDKIKLSNYIDQ